MFSKPSEMNTTNDTLDDRFRSALAAIGALLAKELNELWTAGWSQTLGAHFDIEHASIDGKGAAFYRHIVPLRHALVTVLAGSYRRFFKLALANPRQTGRDPHGWAAGQLYPAVRAAIEWIFGWYIQACDGVQPLASVEVIPGQTISIPIPTTVGPTPRPEAWRAPAWLFEIGLAFTGIGTLKEEHVPEIKSEEKLSEAYTRLLLKGARRMFLWELEAAVENIKNEETAAAGTLLTPMVSGGQKERPKKPKHWLRGVEGLVKQADLSQYWHGLTPKQQLAAALKWEYGVSKLSEIASRMGINRKTAAEHIDAANKKIKEIRSNEKRRSNRAKNSPEQH